MTNDAATPDDGVPRQPDYIPPAALDAHGAPSHIPPLPEDRTVAGDPVAAGTPAYAAPQAHPVSRGLAVLLALVCVLALFGAGYVYWLSRSAASEMAARLDTLEQSISGLGERMTTNEQLLAALEHRPVPPPADLRPLEQRLATLEQKPPVDLRPLDQRLTALEQKPPPVAQLDAAGHAEVATVAGRVDQLVARQDQLGTREQTDIAKLGDQLASQDTRLAAQDAKIADQDRKIAGVTQAGAKAGGEVDALAARSARLAALQSAAAALATGRPLGPVPGAPPALAQFADKAPPTDASLRLSFDEAAAAAREAGLPPQTDGPLLSRMWGRMQSLVTVRQGDRVLVGDAVTGILEHARTQLEAGDVAGAVGTLDQLAGPAAAAMAPWRQQAQSLLDARAAMLALARG